MDSLFVELENNEIEFQKSADIIRKICVEKKTMSALNEVKEHRNYKCINDFIEMYDKQHDLSDESMCITFCGRKRNTILFPCKHVALCSECVKRLVKCPICATRIQSRETFFS